MSDNKLRNKIATISLIGAGLLAGNNVAAQNKTEKKEDIEDVFKRMDDDFSKAVEGMDKDFFDKIESMDKDFAKYDIDTYIAVGKKENKNPNKKSISINDLDLQNKYTSYEIEFADENNFRLLKSGVSSKEETKRIEIEKEKLKDVLSNNLMTPHENVLGAIEDNIIMYKIIDKKLKENSSKEPNPIIFSFMKKSEERFDELGITHNNSKDSKGKSFQTTAQMFREIRSR